MSKLPSDDSSRSLRGRIAAHMSWARTENRSARTARARQAFLDRFEREADPDGTLPDDVRTARAEHLRKAHFTRLALASKEARARRARRASKPVVEAPNDPEPDLPEAV